MLKLIRLNPLISTHPLIWLAWGKGAGDLTQVKMLPWWVVIDGIIGVAVVVCSIVVAPVLGIVLFFICVVAGQLLGSTSTLSINSVPSGCKSNHPMSRKC